MNTMRLGNLNKIDKNIFRITELKQIWGIDGRTLQSALLRLVKSGSIYPIIRNIYSKIPINKLHPYELGCALAGQYSYVTTETVLFNNGHIMQPNNSVTLVGLRSRRYLINGVNYNVRALGTKYIHNTQGLTKVRGYTIASSERAIADMYHYNPNYYIDNMIGVDKKELKNILTNVYNNDYSIK